MSEVPSGAAPTGTQTLLRGLAVIDAVARGACDLKSIGERVGTTRSTTHRLVSALVEERYLRLLPQGGYRLGARLIELGFQAREEVPLVVLAEPWLARLSASTGDTIHLAVRDGDEVLYLHKTPGRNGPEMRSRVGHRMPLMRTGIGKALLLEAEEAEWLRLFEACPLPGADWQALRTRMQAYVAGQYAFDLEDNEPSIRCVAAPVRDASRRIVAAISVASTSPYMPDARMADLLPVVCEAAKAISAELGAR
ncbi:MULTISPECIES: IclR family transcriptional regulator [unclassified Pseudomonas]|uniref:IclR family transcriptional regulator n=1 Tax=unclassified Pseudomonas TaxID=196821 RepID=UPI000BD1AD4D|nr:MULTISPECIES: IclR family transcriptional regulator [unclassified Pseudomonas]PVZ20315.1 IclR family transcriptional regulator [Pseudomonas sp. URIL14HWK12:I12]PVZ27381.1 IclR family transcriptional regulator [Pseudomonas sp. URIL14HWK12:I10]PVZ38270.1 IclR family transcriptional regulator [Pseudomonas sp. URIL14HWK12:I11]SNZ04021.1 transcriptional regulator, IclR family [Pseudomonas sp. URIL14HWK12:I9]